MSQSKTLQRRRLACIFTLACSVAVSVIGEEAPNSEGKAKRDGLKEPVFRVAKHPDPAKLDEAKSIAKSAETRPTSAPSRSAQLGDPTSKIKKRAPHPLDEALEIARASLKHIDSTVKDYTCTLVKRERINGKLLQHEFMDCKIRQPQSDGTPFSVYMKFSRPSSMKGREVIYVKGRNSGNLIVHEGGFKSRFLPTVSLKPTSALAMRNQRYPITEIGLRTLTERLIEKGERDRKLGTCKVRILRGAKVSNRSCTCVEVRHDDRRPEFDFHVARVFVDSELNIPIRYEAYEWPARAGGKMQLIEEYTYVDVKLNVGLTDKDFDRGNKKYNF